MKNNIQIDKYQQQLIDGLIYADQFISKHYFNNINKCKVLPIDINSNNIRLFNIRKIAFNKNENTHDKLISVYGALNNINSHVMLVLTSTGNKVEMFLGTYCEQSSTAGSLLENALQGNFCGTDIVNLSASEIKEKLINNILPHNGNHPKNVSAVTLVPSLRDEKQEYFTQGIEKIIDSLAGRDYTALFIAEPLSSQAIKERKSGLENLYTTISPFSEISLAYGKNESIAVAKGTFSSFSQAINEGINKSVSESQSTSTSQGTSSSDSFSGDYGSFSESSSSNNSYGSSLSWSHAISQGTSDTTSSGKNTTTTQTRGTSATFTIKHLNKSVLNLMKVIEQHIERIDICKAFGLWSVAAYFVSSNIQTTIIGASSLRALLAGNNTQLDNIIINTWDGIRDKETIHILKSISHAHNPMIQYPKVNNYAEQLVKPTVMISGKELPFFLGLPQSSVPGVVVHSMASFGRDVFTLKKQKGVNAISLGKILHNGIPQNIDVPIELEEFRSHCFITGSTGSGKSNTAYYLLESFVQKNIPFLVIEPAKGEYKFAFGKLKNINIFTTLNNSQYSFLKLNPFSFPDEIHVLEHIDRVIEIFNACWPMYAAMPAMLKSSIEKTYIKLGWDLLHSKHFPVKKAKFPTFRDLLVELPLEIANSSYSENTKNDYTGALVTRVNSMANGIIGQIFCNQTEIKKEILFDENTIVDLSRIGSQETKALLMGILIMKLSEYRMSTATRMNQNLKHITVLEEAHNILRQTNTMQSNESVNVAGKSVEMISNSIAEMRTYGEGFIIIDQSPSSVDISAMKSTNTKIVMRLPEKTDATMVGATFSLDEDQLKEVAQLHCGTAIVSQRSWLEPVMVKIHHSSNIYECSFAEMQNDTNQDYALENFFNLVLQQKLNKNFNVNDVLSLLKQSTLGKQKKEHLMECYTVLQNAPQLTADVNDLDTAVFLIDSLQCHNLADIFPLRFKGGTLQENWATYNKWYEKIYAYIDSYAVFNDVNFKKHIIRCFVAYMAKYIKDSRYVLALNVLGGKQHG